MSFWTARFVVPSRGWIAAGCLLALLGCQRRPPAAVPAAAPRVAPNGAPNQPPAPADIADGTAQAEPANAAGETPASSTGSELPPPAATDAPNAAPQTPPPPTHDEGVRILLLTADGPLIVDVRLAIDGQPYQVSLRQVVDQALMLADDNQDGSATWNELVHNPRFKYGQFGNLAAENDDQRRQLAAMYDANQNQLVDREELPRYLTRNAGASRSFSLASSGEHRGDNRARSATRLLLDVDRDGAITAAEAADAPQRLWIRDANDDEVLTLEEITGTDQRARDPDLLSPRRSDAPHTAIALDDRVRWSGVHYALCELYSYGEPLTVDAMPLTPDLFGELDQNGNGELDVEEAPRLAVAPPHLAVTAAFAGSAIPHTTLQLQYVAAPLRAAARAINAHDRRLSISLPLADLVVFVQDDPAWEAAEKTLAEQWPQWDADGDDALNAAEFPAGVLDGNAPFDAIDRDQDGRLVRAELIDHVRQRQAVVRSQIRARAADQPDALFRVFDANGDDRLTPREVDQAPAVLRRLDRNRDDRLQSHELPGSMALGFVRGDPGQDRLLFRPPAATAAAGASEPPRWFRGMDVNRDGEVGRREFLGSAAQFDQLDANRDGAIEPAEAVGFETLRSGGDE